MSTRSSRVVRSVVRGEDVDPVSLRDPRTEGGPVRGGPGGATGRPLLPSAPHRDGESRVARPPCSPSRRRTSSPSGGRRRSSPCEGPPVPHLAGGPEAGGRVDDPGPFPVRVVGKSARLGVRLAERTLSVWVATPVWEFQVGRGEDTTGIEIPRLR